MYKGRKETTHERVGERKTYINIIEEKTSTIYVYKWSQDLMYKNNVSKKKEKERYILFSIYPSNERMNTPPNKNGPIITPPLRMTTLISQNYSPFLSRVTKGKSVK